MAKHTDIRVVSDLITRGEGTLDDFQIGEWYVVNDPLRIVKIVSRGKRHIVVSGMVQEQDCLIVHATLPLIPFEDAISREDAILARRTRDNLLRRRYDEEIDDLTEPDHWWVEEWATRPAYFLGRTKDGFALEVKRDDINQYVQVYCAQTKGRSNLSRASTPIEGKPIEVLTHIPRQFMRELGVSSVDELANKKFGKLTAKPKEKKKISTPVPKEIEETPEIPEVQAEVISQEPSKQVIEIERQQEDVPRMSYEKIRTLLLSFTKNPVREVARRMGIRTDTAKYMAKGLKTIKGRKYSIGKINLVERIIYEARQNREMRRRMLDAIKDIAKEQKLQIELDWLDEQIEAEQDA